jgi:hypothetical protein
MSDQDRPTVSIPEAFVPYAYTNDPDTEDLIFGDMVQIGMVVIKADAVFRGNPDGIEMKSLSERTEILKDARWCRVEDIRRRGDHLTIIGLYADGSKATHMISDDFGWYVKKASMPS